MSDIPISNGTLGTPKSEASKADVPMPDALTKILRAFIEGESYRENPIGLLFCNRNNGPTATIGCGSTS